MENTEQIDMRTRRLILKELMEITELWVNVPIARHLRVILRPNKDIYSWDDKKLLKKLESYRYELECDATEDIEDEDQFEIF